MYGIEIMNKNMLLAFGAVCFYNTCVEAVITNVHLPDEATYIENPVVSTVISQQVDQVIDEEISGKPEHEYLGWRKIKGLILAEGNKYLTEYVQDKLTEKNQQLIQKVFSEKHFSNPNPNSAPQIDILNADENTQFELYDKDPYLGNALYNAVVYGSDGKISNRDKSRIDPCLFMIDGEQIRKFFFKKEKWSFDDFKKLYEREKKSIIFEAHLNNLFSPENFGFPKEPQERSKYYLNHDISFLNQKLMKDVFIAAQRIIKMTKPGDNIVVFGNTPYFVGRAIKLIMEKDQSLSPNVIEFPFSGSPNRIRPGSFPNPEDIVTKDRLTHLQQRLRKQGLMADNPELFKRKTYFMDIIASGAGIAYTIETILHDIKAKGIQTLPEFEVISLNVFDLEKSNNMDLRQASISLHSGKDGDNIQLMFPSKEKTHFTIDCQIVYLPGHEALDFLPDSFPKLRIFPRYNAAYWNSDYDYLLTEKKPSHIQIMLDHFDTNIRYLMDQEKKAIN